MALSCDKKLVVLPVHMGNAVHGITLGALGGPNIFRSFRHASINFCGWHIATLSTKSIAFNEGMNLFHRFFEDVCGSVVS